MYTIQIAGPWEKRCAVAEVTRDDDGRWYAAVYEDSTGWHVDSPDLTRLSDPECTRAILNARERLLNYPNRTGVGMPDAHPVVQSAWLLQRADGKGWLGSVFGKGDAT